MATVKKLKTTRWYIADPDHPKGRREAKPNAPGAVKVREEGDTYTIVYKVGGKKRTHPTGLKDKRAAQKYLADWITARERGQQGLTDPFKVHLDRSLTDHLTDYVAVLRAKSQTAYPDEVERELTRLFTATGANLLRDLTADRITKYLVSRTSSPRTRNLTRTYAVGFFNYLVGSKRIATNPITKHSVPTFKDTEHETRRRRAITPKELRSLLAAVKDHPVAARSVNKGGRPKRDGTPAQPRKPVTLAPETLATLRHRGRERQLMYRLAISTGLRRGELSRLQVRHVIFGKSPRIDFNLTKNKRRAVIPIGQRLAADLREWIADTNRGPKDKLLNVPCKSNLLTRVHRPALKIAGISYQTDSGFADFHSLRKSINTYLRRRGVSLRLRQRFLRHTAADLATAVYDDERRAELKPVAKLLARLDRYLTRPADKDVKHQDATPAAKS